jgi:hypothetical protein
MKQDRLFCIASVAKKTVVYIQIRSPQNQSSVVNNIHFNRIHCKVLETLRVVEGFKLKSV